MAVPRVFVSSTCYDLKYIRENLKYFIKNLGFEPVLSENGDIFYNTSLHTHESCISEIQNTQIFVLIIGGRYGGKYKNTEISITNKEYEEALKLNIPIFTLIEKNVYREHHVYLKNINNNDITYPSVDNIEIFKFIDFVRKQDKNNAFCPFEDFSDIELYLKKQWAGMLYSFLTSYSEKTKVAKLFESIDTATQKIEFFTRQLINNSEQNVTKLSVNLYDIIANSEISHTLRMWGLRVSPKKILSHDTLDKICNNQIEILKDSGYCIAGGGPPYKLSKKSYTSSLNYYTTLREELIKILKENNYSINDYINAVSD